MLCLPAKSRVQEVQDYNTSAVGLGRALAGLETGGLQVNQGLMKNFEGLQLNEGNTNLTKMRKLASMRQETQNALEAALANPRLGKAQIQFATKMLDNVKKAIPWTPHNVTLLEYSKNPQARLSDFAGKQGLGEAKAAIPPAAVAKLSEGHETTFGNGQTWTLRNGQPVQVR